MTSHFTIQFNKKLYTTLLASSFVVFANQAASETGELTTDSSNVIFSDNAVAPVSFWDITQIFATVPYEIIDGPVVVETATGTSNTSPFVVGSSAVSDANNPSLITDTPTGDMLTATGEILENTRWSEPLVLTGDITIPQGFTLIIDPGVTIYFDPKGDDQASGFWPDKVEINVEGTLIAKGTVEDPIQFASYGPSPAPGDWGGIIIRQNSTESSISHCMISHAKSGIRFGDFKTGGGSISGHVSHCIFQRNETGIHMSRGPWYPYGGTLIVNPIIENSLIRGNSEYGIYIQSFVGYGTARNEALIQNNNIIKNGTGVAIKSGTWWLGHTEVVPSLISNSIRDNHVDGLYISAAGSSDWSGSDTDVRPIVENNLLANNGNSNISLMFNPMGSDGTQSLAPVVRYNTIINARDGIHIEDTEPYDTMNPTIDHNVFYKWCGYAVNNLTDRPIVAQSNYWGNTEAAWDTGPLPSDTNGNVDTDNHLDSLSAPILTRIEPAAGQPGDAVTLWGANFGRY